MAIVDALLKELEFEAATTKRVLERVPADKLAWKPHPKSFTLGRLAKHVATIPKEMSELITPDKFELDNGKFDQSEPQTTAEILRAFEESVAAGTKTLKGFDDAKAKATWKLLKGGKEIFSGPRIVVVRSFLMNHWYHHRGQLTVYLRLLDVPVPMIYGPSADENPFQ